MGEHRFLQPNPVLLLENARPRRKITLAHELGEGAKCIKCGDRCPGFQLHYWRKVCQNCRCGKLEHNVVDSQDPGFYFVGKIFDRPLRSKEEEMEFIYGAEEDSDDGGDNENKFRRKKSKKKVRFDWIPPNISRSLAQKYMLQLPQETLPIAGTEGSKFRMLQLEKQFPVHDIEPAQCHELTAEEIQSMENYVTNVRLNVVGQGIVTEINLADFPPPPSPELLEELSGQFRELGHRNAGGPPPLPGRSKSGSPEGTFKAEPYHGAFPSSVAKASITGQPVFLGGARPYHGSTSSSLDSSRNGTPSPTSSNDERQGYRPNNNNNGAIQLKVRKDGIVPNSVSPSSSVSPTVSQPTAERLMKNANVLPTRNKKFSSAGTVSGRRCEECRKELVPGDVAVQADRAGRRKMWHPGCFKCFHCQDLLVDLLYYYDSGRIYCARDYAAHAQIPRCHACDELIFADEYTGAEDKAWHLKHFCCFECDRPLAGHKYIPVNHHPHCLLCYQSKHGKTCGTCCQYIDPEEQRVSLQNDHWHARPECFLCAVCHVSLLDRKMTKKDGLILCSSNCSRMAKKMSVASAAGSVVPGFHSSDASSSTLV